MVYSPIMPKLGNRIIILLAAVASYAVAQNPADDPGGWSKAKWRMTEKQLREAFPQAETMKDGSSQTLGIRNFLIAVTSFKVIFGDDEGGLYRVRLMPEGKGIGNEGTPEMVVDLTKAVLLPQLTDNYGKPTQTTSERNVDGGGTTQKWEWIFPTTQITLEVAKYGPGFADLDRLELSYQLREKHGAL